MNFSAWAIRNPIAPILAFALLTIVGIQSFLTLPITRFPNIDVPLVAITVVQSGAAPSEMEAQITKEIEDAVAGITGVDDIASTVSDGISITNVIFRLEHNKERMHKHAVREGAFENEYRHEREQEPAPALPQSH